MEKQEIKKHIIFLEEILAEFRSVKRQQNEARNQKLRDKAENDLELIIQRFEIYAGNNEELLRILLGEGNDTDKAFKWEELVRPRYFENDLEREIQKLKNRIEE